MEAKQNDGCISIIVYFLAVLLVGLMLISLNACKSIQYVPVETIKHDSIYLSKLQRDSVYLKEYVNVYQKADTIYINKVLTKYREVLSTDTIYRERRDTIRMPYPVEASLTKWEKRFISIGKISVGVYAVLIMALGVFILLWIWKRK